MRRCPGCYVNRSKDLLADGADFCVMCLLPQEPVSYTDNVPVITCKNHNSVGCTRCKESRPFVGLLMAQQKVIISTGIERN